MYLDPQIRNWVFIPLMLIMILIGLLRSLVLRLLNSQPKPDLSTIREQSALQRLRMLRQFHHLLPWSSFQARKQYWINAIESKEYLVVKEPTQPSFDDPKMMNTTMEMMTRNIIMFIPQTVIMSWVSFVFSGFVLTKVPFPLTLRFKAMLQSGVDTSDMDVRWVSSLSWYFLLLVGLGSVYTLLGDQNAQRQGLEMMQPVNPMAQPAEIIKMFKSEGEFLELVKREEDDVVGRLIQKYTPASNKKLD